MRIPVRRLLWLLGLAVVQPLGAVVAGASGRRALVRRAAAARSGGRERGHAHERASFRAGDDAMELHRGRLIDHVHLVVADLEQSKRFYRAVLEALGRELSGEGSDHFFADELFVSSGASPTGRTHLAFQAVDRASVDRFHAAGLRSGGRDNGRPGERPYHSGHYAAFVLDPDGNNIEAVFHGPTRRSAESVVITPAS